MDHLATINKHARDDSIQFDEEPHIYTVHDDSTYISVTTLCHSHFEKFDSDKVIDNMMKSKNWPNNKYYEYDIEPIMYIQESQCDHNHNILIFIIMIDVDIIINNYVGFWHNSIHFIQLNIIK